jgi:natural product precursor
MTEEKKLSTDEMNAVSGGQHVFKYNGEQLHCRCGCSNLTYLGWQEEPSGNCTVGHMFSCNNCGQVFASCGCVE